LLQKYIYFIFGRERYLGSEVGGPVVKSEIFITMGMWEEEITFILKKKTFLFAG
jgi:hypothetical protein